MTFALSLAVAALAASASAMPTIPKYQQPPTYPAPAQPPTYPAPAQPPKYPAPAQPPVYPAPGPAPIPNPKPPASYTIPGYTGVDLKDSSINAPTDSSCYTYITEKKWNDGTYSPQRCVDACEAETKYNAEHLSGRATCRFVNTYVLSKNGASQGQVCAMYTRAWDTSFATNIGYTDKEDKYTISMSWSYSNSKDAGGAKSCIPPLPEHEPTPEPPATYPSPPKEAPKPEPQPPTTYPNPPKDAPKPEPQPPTTYPNPPKEAPKPQPQPPTTYPNPPKEAPKPQPQPPTTYPPANPPKDQPKPPTTYPPTNPPKDQPKPPTTYPPTTPPKDQPKPPTTYPPPSTYPGKPTDDKKCFKLRGHSSYGSKISGLFWDISASTSWSASAGSIFYLDSSKNLHDAISGDYAIKASSSGKGLFNLAWNSQVSSPLGKCEVDYKHGKGEVKGFLECGSSSDFFAFKGGKGLSFGFDWGAKFDKIDLETVWTACPTL